MMLINPSTCGAGKHRECDGPPCECPCGHGGQRATGDSPLRKAIDEALLSGGTVPLGRSVLCDFCDEDLTDDARSGGFLFGSKAIGPCCAAEEEQRIRGYGEEHYIRARCPEGVLFADWVRGMRGPDAAVRVTRWGA